MSGNLYLVSTPIGNLGDMTARAIDVIRNADLIAAEDTRRAKILLSHFDLHTPLTAYHMHNEHKRTSSLIEQVLSGKNIALLTDAGTPAIADPGFLITREAVNAGIEPIVIPGASALTFAAAAAGLPVDSFIFAGFLPPKAGKRASLIRKYRDLQMTTFFFESPFKIEKLIDTLAEICGDDIQIVLIREATKIYEEIIRGTAGQLKENGFKTKGEFVVCVDMRTATLTDEENTELDTSLPRKRKKRRT